MVWNRNLPIRSKCLNSLGHSLQIACTVVYILSKISRSNVDRSVEYHQLLWLKKCLPSFGDVHTAGIYPSNFLQLAPQGFAKWEGMGDIPSLSLVKTIDLMFLSNKVYYSVLSMLTRRSWGASIWGWVPKSGQVSSRVWSRNLSILSKYLLSHSLQLFCTAVYSKKKVVQIRRISSTLILKFLPVIYYFSPNDSSSKTNKSDFYFN